MQTMKGRSVKSKRCIHVNNDYTCYIYTAIKSKNELWKTIVKDYC